MNPRHIFLVGYLIHTIFFLFRLNFILRKRRLETKVFTVCITAKISLEDGGTCGGFQDHEAGDA